MTEEDRSNNGPKSKGPGTKQGNRYNIMWFYVRRYLQLGYSPYSFSSAVVTINIDGTVELHVGCQDIGQGSNTTMAIIAAETLGVRVEDIKVHSGDTDHCPADLGAWGSRQTLMAGNAVKMACEDAKRQLLEFAYAEMGLNIVYEIGRAHV
jgi:4-hydroxybenzoyl-CoA reductase subunit alpha